MRLAIIALLASLLMGEGNTSPSISLEDVANEIRKHGILHEKIVLAQAVHETGWFECTDCSLDKNNIFGWRWKGRYMEFDTWQESVAYYARWQDRHYKGGNYYEFLKKKGFATDPNYIKKIKKLKFRYKY
jgi:flagellum-specific peptidoglycan hydrolase FlgJ